MERYSPVELTFAKFFSLVFHPMVMPTVGMVFFFQATTYLQTMPDEGRDFIFMVTISSTFALPLLALPFFYYRRMIRSVTMDNANERVVPFAVSLIFYLLGYYLLYTLQVPAVILGFILASAIIVGLATLISYWWKISVHMMGIGGLLGGLTGFGLRMGLDMVPELAILSVGAGVIAWSRLRLNAHTPLQVAAGLVAGITSSVILVLWY